MQFYSHGTGNKNNVMNITMRLNRFPVKCSEIYEEEFRGINRKLENMIAWQWAETLVEIRGTLVDIRGTNK